MNQNWIDKQLASMSLEEKVGQVLLVGFWNLSEETFPKIKEKVLKYNIGGFFHFYQPQTFLANIFEEMQKEMKVPMLVASDYELGAGWMVAEGTSFPRPMSRGFVGDPQTEYGIGKQIAVEARSIGANMTFSPVVDVNKHPFCPDVNVRAYCDDADVIGDLSVGYVRGIQENGLLATAKHFPGNGGTSMDQHIGPARVDASKEVFDSIYWAPYKRLIKEADLAAIMVGHLEVPALCTEINPANGRLVPASASKEIMTDLLKGELGFKGLVMTDAMNMGGVNSHFSREEANVKTLAAGSDIILDFYPLDFERNYNAILDAVQKGELSEERLNDAVKNVLTAKAKVGLDQDGGMPKSDEEREKIFLNEDKENLAKSVAENAVTLLRDHKQILPIQSLEEKKVLVINVFGPENHVAIDQGQQAMSEIVSERLKERGADVHCVEVTSNWSHSKVIKLVNSTPEYEYTFINFFVVPSWGIGTMVPNHNAVRLFFNGIITIARNLVITAFGDPYVNYYCPTAPTFVATFDESVYSQETAVKAWLGEISFSGKMPVTLDGFFERGDGIVL